MNHLIKNSYSLIKMMSKSAIALTLTCSALFSLNAVAANDVSNATDVNAVATLRDATKIEMQKQPNRIPKIVNQDVKKRRNYPMQPPVIPHTIRNYEVNTNNNKCVSCHSRVRTEESQAPMISVTHYMDRDGNFLADVSPRRYFCNQCHVTQHNAKPLVENDFIDMHTLMKEKSKSTNSSTH